MYYQFIYNPEWLSDERQRIKEESLQVEDLYGRIKQSEAACFFNMDEEILRNLEKLQTSLSEMQKAISVFSEESESIERSLYNQFHILMKKAKTAFS